MNETLTEALNKIFSVLSILSIAFSLIVIFVFMAKEAKIIFY